MKELRTLDPVSEGKAFVELAEYCFYDGNGWTKSIFPLKQKDDRAYGVFSETGDLEAAMISVDMQVAYFGSLHSSTGVSCVVSDPAHRNGGSVRKLLAHLIREQAAQGKTLSFLYPFLFQFYAGSGYGYLTEAREHIFAPEDIRLSRESREEGSYERFDPKTGNYSILETLNKNWAMQYNGGVVAPEYTGKTIRKYLEEKHHYLYLYRDIEGKPAGYLQFEIENTVNFSNRLSVAKLVYTTASSVHALFHFLWRHRGQCQEIRLFTEAAFPLQHFTKEPRIIQKSNFNWMGRVLDAKAILETKARRHPGSKEIVLSTRDDILESNTGTYRIKGTEVIREPLHEEPLPYSLFSSLVLGGISAEEAFLTGQIPEPLKDSGGFFSKDWGIRITEDF